MKDDSDREIVKKSCQFVGLKNKPVLEVGCANGCITPFLAGRRGQRVAIDPDKDKMVDSFND